MNPKEDTKADLEADFDPADIDEAAQEITDPGIDPAPELPIGAENLTTWDESPATRGGATQKFNLSDENGVGQALVEDGVESADRDQRLAAADPDYEG